MDKRVSDRAVAAVSTNADISSNAASGLNFRQLRIRNGMQINIERLSMVAPLFGGFGWDAVGGFG